MRKLILIVVCAFAAAALPAFAADGAVHIEETFTDEPTNIFGPDPCLGINVTGMGTESGTVSVVVPPSGGAHVRVDLRGSVDLYEATNPDPSDPQPGDFVGTWTYEAHISDQAPPSFKGAVTGVIAGPFALADGRVLRRQVSFHLTFDEGGLPPKVFFAHGNCSGG
jgi:hypothetical protein